MSLAGYTPDRAWEAAIECGWCVWQYLEDAEGRIAGLYFYLQAQPHVHTAGTFSLGIQFRENVVQAGVQVAYMPATDISFTLLCSIRTTRAGYLCIIS